MEELAAHAVHLYTCTLCTPVHLYTGYIHDGPALTDVEELAAHAVPLAGAALRVSLAVVVQPHS